MTLRDDYGDTPLKVLKRRPTLDVSAFSEIWFKNCDDDIDDDDGDEDGR